MIEKHPHFVSRLYAAMLLRLTHTHTHKPRNCTQSTFQQEKIIHVWPSGILVSHLEIRSRGSEMAQKALHDIKLKKIRAGNKEQII